ncbi:MAG TPA: hypothetical protein DDY37_01630, partial [Legionella sp.]|nr:hypothetical protein [Legionella sp.]
MQEGLVGWDEDAAPTAEQQSTFIHLFIIYRQRGLISYKWLPALRQFNVDVKRALVDEYEIKQYELIQIVSNDFQPVRQTDSEQRMVASYLLFKAGILTATNRETIQAQPASYFFARSLYLLAVARLLDQNSFDYIAGHANIADLTQAIMAMKQTELLNRPNLISLMRRYKDGLGYVLRRFVLFQFQLQFLDQDHFLLLLSFSPQSILGMATDLDTLAQLNLLMPIHCDKLYRVAHMVSYDSKSTVIRALHQRGVLTSGMLLLLLDARNASEPLMSILNMLPRRARVGDFFVALLTAHAGEDVAALLYHLPSSCVPNTVSLKAFIGQSKENRTYCMPII